MWTQIIVATISAGATLGAAALTVALTRQRAGQGDASLSTSIEARLKKKHRYDVFVSSPLAAFASDEAIAQD